MVLGLGRRSKSAKEGKENAEKQVKAAAAAKGLKAPATGSVDLRPPLVLEEDSANGNDADDIISPQLTLPKPAPLAALPLQKSLRSGESPRIGTNAAESTGPFELARGVGAIAIKDKDSSEHVRLEEWSFAFNASRPLQLTGRVFHGTDGYEEGDLLEYTSQLIAIDGRIATTKSGTIYKLGQPAAGFEQLRKQLWISSRTGRPKFDDGSSVPPFDLERPLMGIKLGDVVAAAPVKLPKVIGWSHQSGVALLNEWTTIKTNAGFTAVTGTVYNCAGAYDGADDHQTSTVVDCKGRMLRTVEGAEYYLGFRKDATPEQRSGMVIGELQNAEGIALGLIDDMLAV